MCAMLTETQENESTASHGGLSLREVYSSQCEALRCKKNSYLLKTLSSTPNDFNTLTHLDLSLNFVGRVGIRAVLEVVRITKNLEILCLADNWLNNESVRSLIQVVMDHRHLHHLDLSHNPISHTAGKVLSDYAGKNTVIHTILLEGTLINPALIRIIQQKAQANPGPGAKYRNEIHNATPSTLHLETQPVHASPIDTIETGGASTPPGSAPNDEVERGSQSSSRQSSSTSDADVPIPSFRALMEVVNETPEQYPGLNTLADVAGLGNPPQTAESTATQTPLEAVFELVAAEGHNKYIGLSLLSDVARNTTPNNEMSPKTPQENNAFLKFQKSVKLDESKSSPQHPFYGMGLIWMLTHPNHMPVADTQWESLSTIFSIIQKTNE